MSAASDPAAQARREAGLARVKAAMTHVEEAQRELARAQQDLSAVIGYTSAWTRLGKLHDKVRDEWYRLEAKLRAAARARGPSGELDGSNITADGVPMAGENPHAGCSGRLR